MISKVRSFCFFLKKEKVRKKSSVREKKKENPFSRVYLKKKKTRRKSSCKKKSRSLRLYSEQGRKNIHINFLDTLCCRAKMITLFEQN